MDPLTLGAAGVGAAWVWDSFGKELLENFNLTSKKLWTRFNWTRASSEYRKKVRTLYGTIRVLGSASPTPLGDIFTDVYIHNQPTAFRRFDLSQLSQDPEKVKEGERFPGIELVNNPDNKRIFILGGPGVGKTTFMKYLALQAAEGTIDRVPIFVGLKAWADSGLALMDFIAKQFEICNFPDALQFIEYILNKGEALILFDGLDEVPQADEQRLHIIRELTSFSNKYDQSQCVITCRPAAIDYSFTHFVYVEIARFTDQQIAYYVGKWFVDSEHKRKSFLQELKKEQHRGLHEMASTPLLLSMLCLAFDEMMHFPHRRVEVYEEAIDVLLKKWDSSRNISRDIIHKNLTLGRKRQMFAHIAFETFYRGEYFFSQDDLENLIATYLQNLPPVDHTGEIDAEMVLKSIEAQHGIFVQLAHYIYSFAHLSFQEYFTAKYIAEKDSEKLYTDMFRDYLTDTRWREVLLMGASLLDNADTFFECFQQAIDNLVAGDETLLAMLQWAKRKAEISPTIQYNSVVVRSVYCFFDRIINRILEQERSRDLAQILVLSRKQGIEKYLDLDQARDLNRDYRLAFVLTRTLSTDIAQFFDHALDVVLTRKLDIISDIDIANERMINTELALDIMMFYALLIVQVFEIIGDIEEIQEQFPEFALYIKEIVARARSNAMHALADELENLAVPTANATQDDWHTFGNTLQSLMQQHRDIGYEWKLSEEQTERFAAYLKASKLLLECLQLAYVTDRKGIEGRLLLPPV